MQKMTVKAIKTHYPTERNKLSLQSKRVLNISFLSRSVEAELIHPINNSPFTTTVRPLPQLLRILQTPKNHLSSRNGVFQAIMPIACLDIAIKKVRSQRPQRPSPPTPPTHRTELYPQAYSTDYLPSDFVNRRLFLVYTGILS